jgi:hypothetical protein
VKYTDPTGEYSYYTDDPELIRQFFESNGNVNSYDFSDWGYSPTFGDGLLNFNLSTMTYTTSYVTQQNGMDVVNGIVRKIENGAPVWESDEITDKWLADFGLTNNKGILLKDLSKKSVREPLTDFWDYLGYYALGIGATYSDCTGTWNVSTNGYVTGPTPTMGFPPDAGMRGGMLKGGKLVEKMGKAKGNMTRNRNVQQKQFDSVVRDLKLNKTQAEQLHQTIHGQGYGYQEILQEAKFLFNK